MKLRKPSIGSTRPSQDTPKFLVTVVAAVAGVVGSVAGAFITSLGSSKVEADKLRTQLVLGATANKSKTEATALLRYYAELGLLASDPALVQAITKYNSEKLTRDSAAEAQSSASQPQVDPPLAAGAELQVNLAISQTMLFAGDRMRLTTMCSHDCNVRVYHIDKEGGLSLIFPFNRSERSLRLLRGEARSLEMVATAPYGFEAFVAIASKNPFPLSVLTASSPLSTLTAKELQEREFPSAKPSDVSTSIVLISVSPRP